MFILFLMILILIQKIEFDTFVNMSFIDSFDELSYLYRKIVFFMKETMDSQSEKCANY